MGAYADRDDHNRGDERNNDDLEVSRAVSGEKRVIHVDLARVAKFTGQFTVHANA